MANPNDNTKETQVVVVKNFIANWRFNRIEFATSDHKYYEFNIDDVTSILEMQFKKLENRKWLTKLFGVEYGDLSLTQTLTDRKTGKVIEKTKINMTQDQARELLKIIE